MRSGCAIAFNRVTSSKLSKEGRGNVLKPKALLGTVSLGLLALVLLLGTADTAQAQTFNPSYQVMVTDTQAGASSDITLDFNLAKGDVQIGPTVFFIPPEWTITPGDEIPIGAVVGELTASATLGLINAPCDNVLPVGFNMLNASIDPSDTVDYLDTDKNGTEDYAEDKDGSGLQDGIEKYPDFITRVLDDEPGDEVGQPLRPIRRAAGISIVAGINVLLQFLIFEPGTFINENISNDEGLGYPSVTLLQNAGDPDTDPIPGPITDFCTPLVTTNTTFGVSKDNGCTDSAAATLDPICEVTSVVLVEEGVTDPDESGVTLFTNPQEGTYTFSTFAAGQRDADGDGFENGLDTCPLVLNQGDARIKGDGDFDEDGLDAACDPDDNNINSDEDLDGYLNRQDNCPLVANGEEGTNQRDTDNDQIGDDCDPNPDNADTEGDLIFVVLTSDVTIGPGGPTTDETPAGGTTGDEDEDGGLSTGTLIGIIVGVIAAVVVLGGGAFYFMRRGGGGGGATA